MSIFFRPYLLTDGRSPEGGIGFSGRPGYHFIYDECVLGEIRQDWAYFLFGVWFLLLGRGVFLMGEWWFWSGNGGFRVELDLFWDSGWGILDGKFESVRNVNGFFVLDSFLMSAHTRKHPVCSAKVGRLFAKLCFAPRFGLSALACSQTFGLLPASGFQPSLVHKPSVCSPLRAF
ncbi:MAG TPA: hypothetical protein O0W87_00600, partial [Methanocorpusculum sp.]|nr:hypothetical protein [Methanocorpusculum sp.]